MSTIPDLYPSLYSAVQPAYACCAANPQQVTAWQNAFRPALRRALGLEQMASDLAHHQPHAERRSSEACDVQMGFQFLLDGDLKGPLDLLVSISLKGPCGGDWSQPANVHGKGSFVGTLGEAGGSFDVTMSAKHEQDYVAHGQFVIQHAAGDLAGLHGILDFAGSVGGGGTYCGDVHFAP